MAFIQILAWASIPLGLLISVKVGRTMRKTHWFASIFLTALIACGIGIAMCGVTLGGQLICMAATLCADTNELTVWSPAYPLMAVPLFWIACMLARASIDSV